MKIKNSLCLLTFSLLAFCSVLHAAESESPHQSTLQENQIPIKVNVGFGLSQYQIVNAYNNKDAFIYGTELSISGVVDKETIKKYKNKVPKKYRKSALKLNEASVTHLAIPRTLYIQPFDGQKSAFGATWGLVPTLSFGWKYLSIGLGGGIIATYLYIHDDKLNDTVNFIRPGVRGVLNFQIPLFSNNFILEGGIKKDAYIPQKMFGENNVWHFSGSYIMFHFRYPTTIEADI